MTLSPARSSAVTASRNALQQRFIAVREHTLALAAPLSAEDQCVQPMPDASPTKWHLAHTSWFFEAVILREHAQAYEPFDPRFFLLFNSYYESLGPRHPRPQRGLLTRPSLADVRRYRAHVDAAMLDFIATASGAAWDAASPLLELGLNHEQQHQELILTDILFALSCNPMLPVYQPVEAVSLRVADRPSAPKWIDQPGGVVAIGHPGDSFAFDNETPRHEVLLRPYRISDRLVTCGEFAEFIADGGYETANLWLSDGWAAVQAGGWRHQLYWIAPEDTRAPAAQ